MLASDHAYLEGTEYIFLLYLMLHYYVCDDSYVWGCLFAE